jgi:hypothetical protein
MSVYLSHLTGRLVWHVRHKLCHTCLSTCLIWLSDSADMSVICYVIRHMSSYVRYVLSCLETYFNRHNSSVISVMLCLVCLSVCLSVLSVIQLSVYVYMNSYICMYKGCLIRLVYSNIFDILMFSTKKTPAAVLSCQCISIFVNGCYYV